MQPRDPEQPPGGGAGSATAMPQLDPAPPTDPVASARERRVRRLATILAVAALMAMLAIITWRSIPLVMQGLSSADDAFFAEWAKAVGQGRGYGAPMTDATSRLFDPTMGGGPAMLLPMTAILLVTGLDELVPGAVTISLFVVQLLLAVVLLARRFGAGAAALYGALLVVALLVATEGFFIFGKYLGEPWTLGFLLIGAAALLAGDRTGWIVAGGVALSLAFLTKQVGAFGAAGIGVAWMVHAAFAGPDRRSIVRRIGVFLIACAALPVAWEAVKLITLGPSGFIALTREELSSGPQAGGQGSTDALATIVSILENDYVAPAALLAMGVGCALAIMWLRTRRTAETRSQVSGATLLTAMLWLGALGQLTYFVLSRSDWPRYLWLTVAVACAGALAPVLAFPVRARLVTLGAGALAAVLLGALSVPADPFAPSSRKLERDRVVAYLDARPEVPYAAVKWSSIYDVVFPRPDEGRWVMAEDLRSLARMPFLYLVNRELIDEGVEASALHRIALERCPVEIDGERLLVRACGADFWTDYIGRPDPTGAGAAGTGEPVPGDLLASVDLFDPGAAALIGRSDDVPPGRTGWSLMTEITDLPAGSTSLASRRVRLDAADLARDGELTGWVKASSTEHLGGLLVVLFADDAWVAYPVMPPAAGTWHELRIPLASPAATSGGFDWSSIGAVYLRADAAADGSYTGQVLWHDLGLRSPSAP
jgi:hypothetical protein